MKKLIALSAAAVMSIAAVSFADPIAEVPGVGTVSEGDGWVVLAEGNDDNGLGPLSGFAGVTDGGQVCADDNGNAEESESPTCAP